MLSLVKRTYFEDLDFKELHDMHHMRVESTLFMVRNVDPNFMKEAVKKVVKNCERCQSIDSVPSVKGAEKSFTFLIDCELGRMTTY